MRKFGTSPVFREPTFHTTLIALGLVGLHCLYLGYTELYFWVDEQFHAGTAVLFRDLIDDVPLTHFQSWLSDYYNQYPAFAIFIWPPFFYVIAGFAMFLWGISIPVLKLTVLGFLTLLIIYLYRLVSCTHGPKIAVPTVVLTALAPIIFEFSRHVMLEIPTLSLCIASLFYFHLFLENEKSTDLLLSSIFAAFAALTKITAAYLLIHFLILCVVRKKIYLFFRVKTIFIIAAVLLLLLPYYMIAFSFFEKLMLGNAIGDEVYFYSPTLDNLLFYPMALRYQLGRLYLALSLLGLSLAVIFGRNRKSFITYLSWIPACYLTFTPLAELQHRHTIYWIPAFAFFTVWGFEFLSRRLSRQKPTLFFWSVCLLMAVFLLYRDFRLSPPYVKGYEDAAKYVVKWGQKNPVILFCGTLEGNFIFFVRKYDPDRGMSVKKSHRIFIAEHHVSGKRRKTFVTEQEQILSVIMAFNPKYIVLENFSENHFDPLINDTHKTIQSNSRLFVLEKTFPIQTNRYWRNDGNLLIYRNVSETEKKGRRIDFKMEYIEEDIMGPAQ